MEISSMASCFGLEKRMVSAAASPSRMTTTNSRRTLNVPTKFSSGTSLTSSHVSSLFGGRSVTSDFSSLSICPSPLSSSSFSSSHVKRNVITMVIPFVREDNQNPPPDLASYLFKHRIVYLGMPLVPAVVELLIAEFIYLAWETREEPIYFYINSTGVVKGDSELGYDMDAFGVYDCMWSIRTPVYTLAVGNAWGDAALLLSGGVPGNRAALPSASIMIKQPYGKGQGQASDVENTLKSGKYVKDILVNLLAKHTLKTEEQIEKDIRRPRYFSPAQAVEYGLIDKVLYHERAPKDQGVVSDLAKDNLT